MKKKILIFGKNSQLGNTLREKKFKNKIKKFTVKFLSKKECDLKNKKKILFYINKFNPNIIINFASYNDVEKAENDYNCFKINSNSIKIINKICIKKNIYFIHISTDYVFDGKKKNSYLEINQTNPLNKYGMSKLKGEKNIINSKNKNFLILRTSWLYSKYNNNFPKKILALLKSKKKINIVKDEYGIPTSSTFVINNLIRILSVSKYYIKGIFHLCPEGKTSRYQFAKYIKKVHKSKGEIYENSKLQHGIVRRPLKIILSSKKIQKKLKINFLKWNKYYTKEML